MGRLVVPLEELGKTDLARAGGKAAMLGELSRVEGVRVPRGFCVTTDGFPALERVAEELTPLLDETTAWAVRSSATAEDLPSASFAGQYDTFLNVVGREAVLEAVARCWASLSSERALAYRLRAGLEATAVRMAVVVQELVAAEASGVLFTAAPVTGHRKTSSIEAVRGLGEALVSGHVTPDTYRVRAGAVTERRVVTTPVLTDAQVLRLEALGRKLEAHFGRPQDVEWCFAGEELFVVQSRPITALFPLPEAPDEALRVYVSVGHQQMMTDAMKPLGASFFRLCAGRPMVEAGGRLFVDVTPMLGNPAVVQGLAKSDPLIGDALRTFVERGESASPRPAAVGPSSTSSDRPGAVASPSAVSPSSTSSDRPGAVSSPSAVSPSSTSSDRPGGVSPQELIASNEASVAALERAIAGKTGSALLEFILADVQELKRLLFEPRSLQVVMAGIEASWWLNDRLHAWLGEKNVADVLTLSVENNVTSQMGLELLDVADALRSSERDGADALERWLERYGCRGVGEIDLTRPRFVEEPALLRPLLLAHVKNLAPGESRRRFESGRRAAETKRTEVLDRLRALPDGDAKADETALMIDRVRAFIGYREYPKFGMVRRLLVYKRALLGEAHRLVQAGVLREVSDVFFLTFAELQEAVRTQQLAPSLVRERKDVFAHFESLTPPRVFTSEGEIVTGSYRREDTPSGALVGLAVSSGEVEGRARVLSRLTDASLEPGDILVTAFTDPSWTPLFLGIKGLITEVGGLMTHGAVVAREYGLPAVVGVEGATTRIRDGQRVRVNGTHGFVELLD